MGIWPSVPASERWLYELARVAGQEAAELQHDEVDVEHLVAAMTRPELGATSVLEACGLDPRRVRDFVMFIAGSNEVLGAMSRGRPRRRTGKNRSELVPPGGVTPEAAGVVVEALDEARAVGTTVGPAHLLVAVCRRGGPPAFFGVTPAEVRRVTGLPARPGPDAHVARRAATHRGPVAAGPLVLGGGGEDVLAEVFARLGRHPAHVAFVGAADPQRRGYVQFRTACEHAGGRSTDTGIYSRDDATDDHACALIRQADVVYLAGGRSEALVEALMATPTLDALIDASDAGAVVMGSSAGAVVLGEATASDTITEDGYQRLDVFGWLPRLHVIPHWRDDTDAKELVHELASSVLAGLDTLLVPELGAVWVAPGWQDLRTLDPGSHHLGAHRLHWPSTTPQPLQPLP